MGGGDFYIDLLFYHLKLRCYVVIELKACDFEPGFGLLLVKGKNETVVEYSLTGYQNPIGVAAWGIRLPSRYLKNYEAVSRLLKKSKRR